MLRLFKNTNNNSQEPVQTNSALLRLKKDIKDLDIPPNTKVKIKIDNKQIIQDPKDEYHLEIKIKPSNQSLWHGGCYTFDLRINNNYPIEPAKVQLNEGIFHPNIDTGGKVCLNILREDWKPMFNLNTIVIGLNSLFDQPNASDPLNQEAGRVMQQDYHQFTLIVSRTLQGHTYKGLQYPKFI